MRRWQYVVVGVVLGITTACSSSPPSTSTTDAASASSAAPSTAPSSIASTPTPSPCRAASEAASGASASASDVLCQLTQSGGLAGATQTVTVYENGDVVAERDRPTASTGTTQASPAQLDTLHATLGSIAWQDAQARYGRSLPDGFAYELHCGDKTVTAYDGAQYPAVVGDVIQQLERLRQQAVQQ